MGAPASADASTAGPATTPPLAHPATLPRVDPWRRAQRRRETVLAIARRLGPVLAARARGETIDDRRLARAFRRVTDDLGASYTKFGQFVASAGGVFGDGVAAEFRTCLDAGPAVPVDAVRRRVERELGRPLGDCFASFDDEPLGSASIAVVHRATTTDGRAVAVKVLRPGITRTVTTDLLLMRQLFTLIGRAASPQLARGLTHGLAAFKAQVREELDLRNEAAAMTYQRAVLAAEGFDRVVVPAPVPDLSARGVLTMDLVDGVAVHDAEGVSAVIADPALVGDLVADALRAWFVTAVRHGVFHGDVHGGNLLVLRDGRIAILDWGIVGRLEPGALHLFRQLLRGALGDEEAMDDVVDDFYVHAEPVLVDHLGLPEDAVRALIRQRARAVFTEPFGEIGIGRFLLDQQGGVVPAGAEDARAERGLLGTLREVEDLPESEPIDNGLLLLGKQLVFFESYAKTHLASRALLEDRAFFTRLLDPSRTG